MAKPKSSARSKDKGTAAGGGALDLVLEELGTIKRLLIAGLAWEGVTQDQLASVLRVTQPTVSRMFPSGLPRPATQDSAAPKRKRKKAK
jgi:hypothetical protein